VGGVIGANSAADVWYIDVDNTSGTQDGTSWATAFDTIQAGVYAAFVAGGGEVWVAEGIYTATADPPVVIMKTNVHIYGGFTGTETLLSERNWTKHPTIIDGEDTRRCVTGADNATLDGFTIKRGYAYNGAAMYNYEASPTVANCIFSDNTARDDAGGIFNDHSSPTFTNCVFFDNVADGTGGGGGTIYTLKIDVSDSDVGTSMPPPDIYYFEEGTEVPIQGLPNSEWRLLKWQSNHPECIADPYSPNTIVNMNPNLTMAMASDTNLSLTRDTADITVTGKFMTRCIV